MVVPIEREVFWQKSITGLTMHPIDGNEGVQLYIYLLSDPYRLEDEAHNIGRTAHASGARKPTKCGRFHMLRVLRILDG